jgi:transcriptional regulator with XRE-family HTH domain
MTTFGEELRRTRLDRGLSLTQLSQVAHYNKGYLSRLESGQKPPSEEAARACDNALDAHGELISAAYLDIAAHRDTKPWQTAELIGRIQKSDTDPVTLEALHSTIFELGSEYAYRDADELRADAHAWLRRIAEMLRKPVGLQAHSELLTATGWLALLVGCLEYDMGLRTAAEVTRSAAQKLGEEADNAEVVGWSYEMSAWFALTQNRYRDVLAASNAAQRQSRNHTVVVQLIAQEAKALARMGDVTQVRERLEKGRRLLENFPVPTRTDNHFIVDPAKWDFYAMDAYRLAREDDLATMHAKEVLRTGTLPDGSEIAPMRMAEARLTLAVTAARQDDLEQAASLGHTALTASRQSLPSLLMVAGELDSELEQRFPRESETEDLREILRALRLEISSRP